MAEVKSIQGNYKGGYVNINRNVNPLSIKIDGDKLVFKQLWKTYHTLDIKDIVDVQFKTEEEISKDVTLTRLLAFGVFAFGMKKKKVSKDYYLIISTLEDDFANDIVLEIDNMLQTASQGFVKTLRNRIVEYRKAE